MTTKTNNRMSYSEATELLGFTTPKSPDANARLATSRLNNMTAAAPLRYKVACNVLIKAAS